MKKNIIVLLLLSVVVVNAQKKPLDHSVYDSWKSINMSGEINNGKYLIYNITPQEGDATMVLYNIESNTTLEIERGTNGVINKSGEYLVYRIKPFFQETREAKIKKKRADDMPKDTLAIMNLKSGEITKYSHLKSYKTPRELDFHLAFQQSEKPAPKKDVKKDETPEKTDQARPAPGAGAGASSAGTSSLLVLDIRDLSIDTIKVVDSYFFNENGDRLAYITKPGKKDSLEKRGIFIYSPIKKSTEPVLTGVEKSKYFSPTFTKKGDKLLFYAQLDTIKEVEDKVDIYVYDMVGGEVEKMVPYNAKGITEDWMIANTASLTINDDGRYLYFGTKPIPPKKDTSLVDFETPRLDIWTWNEDYLPTVQLSNLSRMNRVSYLARIDMEGDRKVVQLEDEDFSRVSISERIEQPKVLAQSDKPYRVRRQWDTNPIVDLYSLDLQTGERQLLYEGATITAVSPSPYGNYYTWYDMVDKNWFIYNMTTGELKNLTADLPSTFWNEDTDTPTLPRPYSNVTWFHDEKAFVLGDRYDLWQFDPLDKNKPFVLTDGYGKQNKTKLGFNLMNTPFSKRGYEFEDRFLKWDEPMFFTTFNEVTRMRGYAYKDIKNKRAKITKLVEGGFSYGRVLMTDKFENPGKKAKKLSTPIYLFIKGNFENSNNLYITKDLFKTEQRLSDINPQQNDYIWGKVEMVDWKTADNIDAQGMLFTPENLDKSKKYPMLIYFYEKDSDGLYNYRSPAPSRSTINIPFFVSNGYVVFVPDIYYFDGHPGQSAMRSIMPGVDMLLDKYSWIDGDNMAIQGQSWGGYQVAYMVTQTNRFKAAGAGAPVSNMTSAYGGIRWESGVTRQFQYEQGQSRIGVDLWEGFDLYIENSPLFFAPNVETPLLIMHNDKDGAVPWYQGIEYYTALRRLQKPVWMLQYNDEAHNLAERRNAKDLSIRLEQFFNHFLKGAPMPVWMKRGIPANLKGIDFGYELID